MLVLNTVESFSLLLLPFSERVEEEGAGCSGAFGGSNPEVKVRRRVLSDELILSRPRF